MPELTHTPPAFQFDPVNVDALGPPAARDDQLIAAALPAASEPPGAINVDFKRLQPALLRPMLMQPAAAQLPVGLASGGDIPPAALEGLTPAEIELTQAVHHLQWMLREAGQVRQAAEVCAQAAAAAPRSAVLRMQNGLYNLKFGNLKAGWPEYGERLRADPYIARYADQNFPLWQGQDLAGKTLFLWREQGVGDEILFQSCLNDFLDGPAKDAVVFMTTQRKLAKLVARSFPRAGVIPLGPGAALHGPVDYQLPIGDLPALCRNAFADFPRTLSMTPGAGVGGYLKPDPARVARYRAIYRAAAADVMPGATILVGVAWRSKHADVSQAKHAETFARKSATVDAMLDVLRDVAPGVLPVSVQYGEVDDLKACCEGRKIILDSSVDTLGDIDDAAAQIAAMDLVVTTSNTCAHLAGALGVPCFVALPALADAHWYWFADRADSPWYPSLRLFRAATPADWPHAPLAQMKAAVDAWIATRASMTESDQAPGSGAAAA